MNEEPTGAMPAQPTARFDPNPSGRASVPPSALLPPAAPAGVPVPEHRAHVASHDAGNRIRIGRALDNDIVLPDLWVSRRHAEVRRTGDGYEVVDLSSSNGIHHNGRRVQRARLAAGDRISIGKHEFVFDGRRLHEYEDNGPASLSAEDLTVRVGNAVLLDDVSFALQQGSLLAVVGPSGCGKSTMLKALTGIRPATMGQVRYDGRDLYQNYSELRYRIGMVPQDDVLHRQLTVRRALRFSASLRFANDVPRKERSARVEEVIATLGLKERAKQRIDTLSGGQRKRTSVALELLTEPSLLCLDEPTSGLDPALDKGLMQELRALADRGRTVIVVTHSVLHLDICDRVLVMCVGGRMGYFGPPGELLDFFEAEDYADVFAKVTMEPDRWAQRYRNSETYRQYVGETLLALNTFTASAAAVPGIPGQPVQAGGGTPAGAAALAAAASALAPKPSIHGSPTQVERPASTPPAGTTAGTTAGTAPGEAEPAPATLVQQRPAGVGGSASGSAPVVPQVPSVPAAPSPAAAPPPTQAVPPHSAPTQVGPMPSRADRATGSYPVVTPTSGGPAVRGTARAVPPGFVAGPRPQPPKVADLGDVSLATRAIHPVAPIRQFLTLCWRMFACIFADRGYSLFLLGLPLALALLTQTVPGDQGLAAPPLGRFNFEAQRLLVVLVVGAAFLGIAISIREIVNESSIYRRERAIGLSPLAYLFSKLVVFAIIATIQVVLYVWLALLGRNKPSDPLITTPLSEIMIPVVLVAFASTVLGLVASALVKTTEQTTPILVVSVMAQLVVSGGLFELAGNAGLEQAAWLAPTRWGFAATGSTVDLNTLLPPLLYDPIWDHEVFTWWRNVLIIVLQIVLLTIAARFALRRLEPGRQ